MNRNRFLWIRAISTIMICIIIVMTSMPITARAESIGKVGRLRAITITKTAITLSWDAAEGAYGYQIQKKDGNTYLDIKKSYDGTVLRVSGLMIGTEYTFRVRAYGVVNKQKIYGDWESVSATTKAGTDGDTSINKMGVYNDNSWNGITVQEIDETKVDGVDNLIHDYKVVDGKVIDAVTGKKVKGLKVSKKNPQYFTGDGKTKIKLENDWDETFEAIVDYDEKKLSGDYPLFYTYIPRWIDPGKNAHMNLQYNSGVYHVKFERASIDPYQSHWLTFDSNYLRGDGMYVYEELPKGDVFVAIATDYTNKKTYARVNGTAVNTKVVNKSNAYKYYRYAFQEMVVTPYHQIKELKIYSDVRNANELKADYKRTGIAAKVKEVETGTDGIAGLGCTDAWKTDKAGKLIQEDFSDKAAGIYTVKTRDGKKKVVGIADYNPVPDKKVSNKGYKSLHITNKRDIIQTGKQYPLTAYPYPLKTSGKSNSNFDIIWSSSDTEVITVMDGLLHAKKAGTATITAKLRGKDIVDSFQIEVKDPEVIEDKVYQVPKKFKAKDGSTFSKSNPQKTLKAIFAAIDYAKDNGYNHVVFPKMKFYASAYTTGLHYYVPSNMTIEFPKGSVLYMQYPKKLPGGVSASDETKCEFHIFEFGVPGNDYTGKCENSHLIIDKYFGERYKDSKSKKKINEDKFIEEYRFVEFGRKAVNCSVQINSANYTAGYFITADGTSADLNTKDGVIQYGDMTKGLINLNGSLKKDKNWISTKKFIKVPQQFKEDGYFMSAGNQAGHYGRYWYWSNANAQLYHIYWFNKDKKVIQVDQWQGVGEYYDIPADAYYYKMSFQQKTLPKPPKGCKKSTPWMTMHDCGAAKDCEIKNTNIYHSATGLFSIVGETDGLYIHNNYVPKNGEKPADARLGDFEDGWLAMRHSVLANNVMDKGEYASGGANNYMHSNYFGNEVYTKTCDLQGHVINNRGVAYLCADQYFINFYYNKVRYGSICYKDRPSMQCRGHLHKNYSRYNLY